MTTIPVNTVTQADLAEWYRLKDELAKVKASEMLLRTKIYKGLFVNPTEGTNSIPLAEGWVIKAKRVIQRDVDLAALQANMKPDATTQVSVLSAHGIHVEQLIKWEPELVLKEYRKLSEEQFKIFNECLVIKDGSPSLEIVLPASAAKKKNEVQDLQDLALGGAPGHEQNPANNV